MKAYRCIKDHIHNNKHYYTSVLQWFSSSELKKINLEHWERRPEFDRKKK